MFWLKPDDLFFFNVQLKLDGIEKYSGNLMYQMIEMEEK